MRKSQQIALFNQGVRAWNTWRANNPTEKPDFDGIDLSEIQLSGAHLSGIDLSLMNLSGVNLSKAYLNETHLQKANLSKTNLRGAHLIEADLSEADLSGTELSNTYLIGANLSKANLSKANLSKANLRRTNFHQANLTNANFSKADVREVNFSKANLSGVSLREANLSQRDLSGNNIENADLCGVNLSGADLSGANLKGANLSGANLCQANLNRANLAEADLTRADLRGANLSETDLRSADLRGADLKGVDFSKADLSGANFDGVDLWGEYLFEKNTEPPNHSDIFGIPGWNVKINEATIQSNLNISLPGDPTITVDNLEVAQVLYLLLNNKKICDLINMLTSRVVLILGCFTQERKPVLDAIRNELRKHNYLPVLFDFDEPMSPNFMKMISTLAQIARFVIADFTDTKTALEELPHIMQSPAVPVQPLLLNRTEKEPVTLFNLRRNHRTFLDTYWYNDSNDVLKSLEKKVIVPAEAKAKELEKR
jgi:uncharacterized protein YjbI with pentapeptide repeats